MKDITTNPQRLVGRKATINGRFVQIVDYRVFGAAGKTFLEVLDLDVTTTPNKDNKPIYDVIELTPASVIEFAKIGSDDSEAENMAERRINREYERIKGDVMDDIDTLRDSLNVAYFRFSMGYNHNVDTYGIGELLHGNVITRVIGNVGNLKGMEYALDAIKR